MFKIIVLFLIYLTHVHSSVYTLATLRPTTILITSNLSSVTCPSNAVASNYQSFPTHCQCIPGYLPGVNSTCSSLGISSCSSLNFYSIYNIDGSMNSAPSCLSCAANAYPNANQTGCISCPTGMTYDAAQGCICTASGNIKTPLGCFTSSISPPSTDSIYYSKLKYLIPGCSTFKDYLSCSQLINLCMYSVAINAGILTQPECIFFTMYNLTSFIYPSSASFALTAVKQGSLQMKLITYLSTGNYLGEKIFQINDIFRCGTPSQSNGMSLGNNIYTQCTYNFNNLAAEMDSTTYNDTAYQLYIMGNDGNYYEIAAYLQGSATGLRRFFLQDTTSLAGKINVANSITLNLVLDSNGNLVTPTIVINYVQLALQDGIGVTPTSSVTQALSFSVTYSYSLNTFWAGAIASLIVVVCLAVVHSIGKTYVGYLNRKSPLLFFLNFLGCLSLWLFYYLLFMTGYWFLFTKTTANIFMLMPQQSKFYVVFYILVAIMGILRIITILIDKNDKMNTEVFIVNWEKSSQNKNSWREIFIINSLAEFYTHRTVSIFWMLIVVLFFLIGVNWWKNAAETTSTDLGNIYEFNPKNRVLMYFLSCAIFLAVGIVFKILRRLSVLFWPYPFEDFVDYCSVTNLSLFFIKKRSPEAFYIHATLPDKTQVSYKQINQAVRKGIQKNRSIMTQLPSNQSLKMYDIYMSRQMQDKFNQMIRKQQDAQHHKNIKYAAGAKDKKKPVKASQFRQAFTDELTKYLEILNSNKQIDRNEKSACEYLFGIPPVNLRDEKALKSQSKVYFDSRAQLISEIFPNGNEFEEIHTLIIIFLIWITITNNPAISAFLTYFVDQWMINGWVAWKCRDTLQRMTRVKKGFML